MSNVQSQIDRIRNNIDAAYIALKALGVDVPADATVDELAALIASTDRDFLPDYWEAYLPDKIAAIKALQRQGGADSFSFVFIVDTHYPANLGKRSPVIAKRIMEECNIKFLLHGGDAQTRGCWPTIDELYAENERINKMFAPVKDKMLYVEGNHDGAYATVNGVTYAKQLTEAEMFEEYFRRVGLVGDVHFCDGANAYYIDDVSSNVRYIGLDAHCVPDGANEDGTAKYNKFRSLSFTQKQFDFLTNDALVTGLTDKWSVVVFAHVAVLRDDELPDYTAMVDLLTAYQNKSTYALEYAGVHGSGEATPNFTNLFDPATCKLNTRLSSSGEAGSNGYILTNDILIPDGVTQANFRITIRNAKVIDGSSRAWFRNPENSYASPQYCSAIFDMGTDENGDTYLVPKSGNAFYNYMVSGKHFQIAFYNGTGAAVTQADADDIILTINEPITYTEVGGAWDALSIDADFTNAKGALVGYFAGHTHVDSVQQPTNALTVVTTRCDAVEENTDDLKAERVDGTITEQSFDVFTINKKTRKIHATKIGAGDDRVISY